MTYKPKYLSNQISLVRDTAYNKIKEIVAASDIVTPKVSEKLDINLKNTLNKILNDYRFQEVNKKEKSIDEESGIWSDFAQEGLDKMQKEDRRKKVFKRVVNPLILKHLVSAHGYDGTCIASGIPIKYLKYFKEVSAHKNAKKIRYRYRGKSGLKTQYKTGLQMHYIRPQSFCHMDGADTFAIYNR